MDQLIWRIYHCYQGCMDLYTYIYIYLTYGWISRHIPYIYIERERDYYLKKINWCRISFSIPLTRCRFVLPLLAKGLDVPSSDFSHALRVGVQQPLLRGTGEASATPRWYPTGMVTINPTVPYAQCTVYFSEADVKRQGEYVIGSMRLLIWPWPCGSSIFMDFNFCFYISASEADKCTTNKPSGFLMGSSLPSFALWHQSWYEQTSLIFKSFIYSEDINENNHPTLPSPELRHPMLRQGHQNQPVLGSRTTAMIFELDASEATIGGKVVCKRLESHSVGWDVFEIVPICFCICNSMCVYIVCVYVYGCVV